MIDKTIEEIAEDAEHAQGRARGTALGDCSRLADSIHPTVLKQINLRDYVERCEASPIKQGQKWRHIKTGNVYHVMCLSLWESNLELAVTYRSDDMMMWSRPASVFLKKFERVK